MNIRKITIASVLLLILSVMLVRYNYKDDRNTDEGYAVFELSSFDLIDQFSASLEGANKKYLDKIIIIHGNEYQIEASTLLLDHQIRCYLIEDVQVPQNRNTRIKIRGRYLGYDELLDEIKLDQCTVIE